MNSQQKADREYDFLQSLPVFSRVQYLKMTYGKRIVKEGDYFYYFDDVVINIHDYDEDGVYSAVAYPVNKDGSTNFDKWDEIATFRKKELTA